MMNYKKLFTLLALCAIATTNFLGAITELRRYTIEINGRSKQVCFIALNKEDNGRESLKFITEVINKQHSENTTDIPMLILLLS